MIAYQQFPPSGPMRTAWVVTFNHEVKRGLFVTRAYFKPGPDRPWMQVLKRAQVSEIFVPYQSARWRFRDFETYDFNLFPVSSRDGGRCGALIQQEVVVRGKRMRGAFIVREVADKGVLWKRDGDVYRGHKMTLWATVRAANYNYIISYAFHDDGLIEFRGGATSQNWPESPAEPHMHNLFWRIDADINGPRNTINVNRHLETTAQVTWQDCQEPFNEGREGPLRFNPYEFTSLHITGQGMERQHAGYSVLPLYRGLQRHRETWTQADMWVTRYRAQHEGARIQQMQQINFNEPIVNEDVVLWVASSLLHLPRNEDGRCARLGTFEGRQICSVWHGSAEAMWTGFDMKPHNIFPSTPFMRTPVPAQVFGQTAYHPPRCPVRHQ